ncbi:MAG TPA: hypothetical protein VM240_02295 [Verrucomicrobiae bacterium]|nr:hypothetical protein [Verrucomicrobiae bacterium]
MNRWIAGAFLLAAIPGLCDAAGLTYTRQDTGVRSGFTVSTGGGEARVAAAHVCNYTGVTQQLYLRLFYSTSPNPASSGYTTATYNIATIGGSNCIVNIDAVAPFTIPPPGTYYVHLLASAALSSSFDDSLTASNTVTITSGGGGGGGGTTSGNLEFGGAASYDAPGNGTVRMQVSQLCNNRSSGTSGTLYWILRYTTGPAPTSAGYTAATVTLNPLTSGFCYFNLDQTVTYVQPPDGVYYAHFIVAEHPATTTIIHYLTFPNLQTISTAPENSVTGGGLPLATLLAMFVALAARRVRPRSVPAP